MKKELLCGNACLKYIFKKYNIDESYATSKDMFWISELALTIKKHISDIKVLCYKSNLLDDYKKTDKNNIEFDGFRYINILEQQNVEINEIKLTIKELKKELQEYEYILLCVKSSIFNNNNLEGGHFIIADGIIDDKIKIINPIKTKYEIKMMSFNELIKCCSEYGSWRVLIKRRDYGKSNSI